MAEVFFYQLDSQHLASVLPQLVAKGLERGLRMAIETAVPENVQQLSEILWGCEDVAFLPHGHSDDVPELQPVWLCADSASPNAATYRFYVDGALPISLEGLARAIIMFESNSEEALVSARNEWKKQKAVGHDIRYYKQDEYGKWQNLA